MLQVWGERMHEPSCIAPRPSCTEAFWQHAMSGFSEHTSSILDVQFGMQGPAGGVFTHTPTMVRQIHCNDC